MNDTTLPIARKEKALRKGFALHDWKLLLNSTEDLAQRQGGPIRIIPTDEVACHSKIHDGWIILHGKIYNIGPYLQYHPGGVEIMKPCLGRDATSLFEKYHRWVNIENLIGKLLIGYSQGGNQLLVPQTPCVSSDKLGSLLNSNRN